MALLEVYFGVFAIFSGYLLPIALLPPWLADAVALAAVPLHAVGPGRDPHRPRPRRRRRRPPGRRCSGRGPPASWSSPLALWRAGVRRFEAVGAVTAAGRYARLLGVQARMALSIAAQYRADFLVQGAMSLYSLAWNLLPLLVLYADRRAVAGWDFPSALVVIGWFIVLRGILEGAINPSLVDVVERIRTGAFDYVLLKPADSQFLVSTARFEPWRVIDVLGGLGLLVYAFVRHRPRAQPSADVAAGAAAARRRRARAVLAVDRDRRRVVLGGEARQPDLPVRRRLRRRALAGPGVQGRLADPVHVHPAARADDDLPGDGACSAASAWRPRSRASPAPGPSPPAPGCSGAARSATTPRRRAEPRRGARCRA